ncbi:unnamed protein product, partial [Choristocarpus tenellus]
GQFVYVIRKRIKLDPEKAIFIFVKDNIPQTCECTQLTFIVNPLHPTLYTGFFCLCHCYHVTLPPPTLHSCLNYFCDCCSAALMSQVYEHQKDEDGFLYITYSGENTFG